MAAEKIEYNLNDFDEQLTSCTFDSQFFDSDEMGENSQLTDSDDKSSNASKKVTNNHRSIGSSNGHSDKHNSDEEEPKEVQKDFDAESWNKFTGIRFRNFSSTELDAFRQPFLIGWKRELLVRDSATNPNKKTVEIQYISPCTQVRLRSYVETGLYFRTNQQTELEPENFTFAKQPVHKRPNERILYLTNLKSSSSSTSSTLLHINSSSNTFSSSDIYSSNGNTTLPPPPSLKPLNNSNNRSLLRMDSNEQSRQSSSSDQDQSNSSTTQSESLLSEGRSKRRRTAPTRFEDEDYSEQNPFKKKLKSSPASTSLLTSKPGSLTLKISTNMILPKLNPIVKDNSFREVKLESTTEETNQNGTPKIKLVVKNVSKEPDSPPEEEEKKPKPSSNKKASTGVAVDPVHLTAPNEESELSNLDKLCTGELISLKANGSACKKGIPVTKPNPRVRVWNLKDLKGPQIVIEPKASRTPPKSLFKSQETSPNKSDASDSSNKRVGRVESKPESSKVTIKTESQQSSISDNFPDDDCDLLADEQADPSESNKNDVHEQSETKSKNDFVPPCSIMCGGRQGDLPSLLCSRCLCLFHPQCVKKGIYLKQTGKFVCPNCIQPTDEGSVRPATSATNNGKESSDALAAGLSSSLLRNRLEPNSKSLLKSTNLDRSKNASLLQPRKILLNVQHGQLKTGNLAAMLQRANGISSIRMPVQANARSSNARPQSIGTALLIPNNNSTSSNGKELPTASASVASKPTTTNAIDNSKNIPNLIKKSPPSASILHTLKNGIPQISPNSKSENPLGSLNNRKFHLDNLNRTLVSSQHLLQSLQKLGAIKVNSVRHPSAPLSALNNDTTLTSAHPLRVRKPVRQRCREYMNRYRTGLDSLMSGYNAMQLVFQHLGTRDLMRCKLVNRAFNNMANQSDLWHSIQLKNVRVLNWQHFGSNICQKNVTDLCFDGLRPCSQESTEQMWRNAASIFPYLSNLKRLSFGQVPMSFLQRLLEHTRVQKTFNQLEELSIRNLFDDSPQIGSCRLQFVEQLASLPVLNSLRIASLGGIRPDSCCLHQLRQLVRFVPGLRHLYLPSLKGFTVEQFDFIERLTQLQSLEIGSCESWITGEVLTDHFSVDSENADEPAITFKGVFKYLCQLTNLEHLKLIDVIVDDTSEQFPLSLQRMSVLKSLDLDGVTVSPDATQTLNLLCNTLKTRLPQLRRFSVSTDDSHTNRSVFELLLKRLDNLADLRWKVGSQVDDSGMCCVPFMQENEFDSDLEAGEQLDLTTEDDQRIEMMEMCYLNDVLQKHLQRTQVSILPQ